MMRNVNVERAINDFRNSRGWAGMANKHVFVALIVDVWPDLKAPISLNKKHVPKSLCGGGIDMLKRVGSISG